MNIQTFQLDITKRPAVAPVLHLGQGDKAGTTLVCEIYDDGQALALSGYTVKFAMRLPGRRGYYEVSGTASGNTATFVLDETYAAAVAGRTDVAYVEIIQGSAVIASTNRITVVVLEGAKTDADPGGSYSNVIDELIEEGTGRFDALNAQASQLVEELSEVEGGYVIAAAGQFDDENLVLYAPEDTTLMATDLADARARIATLEACCTQVNSDLAAIFEAVAGLTEQWMWLGEGLYGPAISITFAGSDAALSGAYDGENLVLA